MLSLDLVCLPVCARVGVLWFCIRKLRFSWEQHIRTSLRDYYHHHTTRALDTIVTAWATLYTLTTSLAETYKLFDEVHSTQPIGSKREKWLLLLSAVEFLRKRSQVNFIWKFVVLRVLTAPGTTLLDCISVFFLSCSVLWILFFVIELSPSLQHFTVRVRAVCVWGGEGVQPERGWPCVALAALWVPGANP